MNNIDQLVNDLSSARASINDDNAENVNTYNRTVFLFFNSFITTDTYVSNTRKILTNKDRLLVYISESIFSQWLDILLQLSQERQGMRPNVNSNPFLTPQSTNNQHRFPTSLSFVERSNNGSPATYTGGTVVSAMSATTSGSSRRISGTRTKWITVELNTLYAYQDVMLYFLEHHVHNVKKSKKSICFNLVRDCKFPGCHYRCRFISKAYVDDKKSYQQSSNEQYY